MSYCRCRNLSEPEHVCPEISTVDCQEVENDHLYVTCENVAQTTVVIARYIRSTQHVHVSVRVDLATLCLELSLLCLVLGLVFALDEMQSIAVFSLIVFSV